jgi:signal transduction histidine kinase
VDIISLQHVLDYIGLSREGIDPNFIHWGGLVLIALGFMLFVIVFYFKLKSKRLGHSLTQLYALNQEVEQDALNFFNQVWPILASAGCVQMQANVTWFGETSRVHHGAKRQIRGKRAHFKVYRDDMSFDVILFLNRQALAPESLSDLVIKTFINILEQDLALKEAEILTSQKRLERYQMYVQHEIKNIAQFIQLLSDQVKQVRNDEAKVRLVNRLTESLPVMAKRARKTIQHMQNPVSEMYETSYVDVRSIIQDVVSMYSLNAKIQGSASINLSRALLLEVFKNILGNFNDHPSSKEPIKIEITGPEKNKVIQIEIIGQLYGVQNEIVSERMFEPFWTTSESGMGLGLFLARELLKQFNGKINFEKSSKEFTFKVILPALLE